MFDIDDSTFVIQNIFVKKFFLDMKINNDKYMQFF